MLNNLIGFNMKNYQKPVAVKIKFEAEQNIMTTSGTIVPPTRPGEAL
ncbi:MAG: hypothetical protein MJ010_01250 [Paludibacteraceae bacterium]|nr:hypothetical protein [Paludibacteraceae bacterium]